MKPDDRKRQILSYLNATKKIDVERLAAEIGVSSMTIRRDLSHLEDEGKVIRTHGGAVLTETLINETPYQSKVEKNLQDKTSIAGIAAAMVPENAKIILDSGTTTLEIAKRLKHRDDLLIVTNDLKIAALLIDSPSQIICTGGELQRGVGSLLGTHVETLLSQIEVDLLFLGAHAVDYRAGVTAPTMEKAAIKRRMIEISHEHWLVADPSKFNNRAFAKVCPVKKLDGIITNDSLDTDIKYQFEQILLMKYAVAKGGEDHSTNCGSS